MLLYRLLVSLFAVATLARALRRGGVPLMRARLSPRTASRGRHVWLHGASNGELASVRPILDHLARQRPDLYWLVTSNTETGVALAESWQIPRLSPRLAPLDLGWATRRVMRDWQVCAHIAVESELWPHRLLKCPGPVLLLGARMSAGTARTWARFPRLSRRLLGRIAFASAQDTASADRLEALGLSPAARGPVTDLKSFYDAPEVPADPALDAAFPRDRTWLAASTHDGDEAVVLDAHAALLNERPDLRLILAPRHPRRAEPIAEQARQRDLTCARRSRDEPPGSAQVYLADSMGEMPLWYARAGRVFIGGTLSDRGGHTPYEPAAYDCALIHGPDTRNFAAAFAGLAKAGAAHEIRDAGALADALRALDSRDAQDAAGRAARDALQQEAEFDAIVGPVLTHLPAA